MKCDVSENNRVEIFKNFFVIGVIEKLVKFVRINFFRI